jgi:hypothetical protein
MRGPVGSVGQYRHRGTPRVPGTREHFWQASGAGASALLHLGLGGRRLTSLADLFVKYFVCSAHTAQQLPLQKAHGVEKERTGTVELQSVYW